MVYIRGTVAVVLGYLIMAGVSMAVVARLFADGQPPPEMGTTVVALFGLGVGAAVGGFLCTLVAGSANSPAVYVAIGVMFFVAGYSFVNGRGIEPDWYRLISSITLGIGFLVGASAAAYKIDRR